jgi:hypothetical protein
VRAAIILKGETDLLMPLSSEKAKDDVTSEKPTNKETEVTVSLKCRFHDLHYTAVTRLLRRHSLYGSGECGGMVSGDSNPHVGALWAHWT